ncbi:MAG: hypothetical protein ABSH22_07480 [Tepidisphaeraceae bacterium]|jgi:hypothetical protein
MRIPARYSAGAAVAAATLALIFSISVTAQGDSPATLPADNPAQSPATAPSDSPATQPAVPLLPQEFSFLETHNPFGRGHGGGQAAGAEASLVFKGAVRDGDKTTAFFEDLSTKKVIPLEAGAAIARGRIKSIDLDAIVYAVANDSQRIEAGENLNGVVIPPAAPASQPSSSVAAPESAPPAQAAAPQGQ